MVCGRGSLPMTVKNTAPRWEAMFDDAVASAASRKLGSTVSMIRRIRRWQRHQYIHGPANHAWHLAELLWLEGVVLERARHFQRANTVWLKLADLYQVEAARWGDRWFLPWCRECASRQLGFAPNWYSVALQLREVSGSEALAALLQRHARGL